MSSAPNPSVMIRRRTRRTRSVADWSGSMLGSQRATTLPAMEVLPPPSAADQFAVLRAAGGFAVELLQRVHDVVEADNGGGGRAAQLRRGLDRAGVGRPGGEDRPFLMEGQV